MRPNNMLIEKLFINLLNMSITASYVVIAVILLRLLLKKAPKWISCALWILVGLRLIMPFSFESAISLIPSSNALVPDILYSVEPIAHSNTFAAKNMIDPAAGAVATAAPAASVNSNSTQAAARAASIIWLIGMLAMLLYSGIIYAKLHRQVNTAIIFKDNIYKSDAISSPFVLGIIKPRIYLPFTITDKDMIYVISHEQAHIRRKDHWIKLSGFLLLSLYWFNPLIWAAYVLLCRDIEIACDEGVIKDVSDDEKKSYSLALLNCAVEHQNIIMCPVAFGEVSIKERVKNVLNYKKPAFWIIIVALIACIIAAICLLSNPKDKDSENNASYKNPYAAQLFEYRTSYVGDNAAVGNIVTLLEFPADVKYDHIELQTSTPPYGVIVHFNVKPDVKDAYKAAQSDNMYIFPENACIIFSLIKNADEITFRLDDDAGNPADLQFTRDWAEKVVGVDLWAESSSADKLDSLIIKINECIEKNHISANEALPVGKFMPYKIIYLNSSYSVTPDAFLKDAINTGKSYDVSAKSFRAGVTNATNTAFVGNVLYENPQYVLSEPGDKLEVDKSMVLDISSYKAKTCYRVLTSEGTDTGYRIFHLDDEIWIGYWERYAYDKGEWWCSYIFSVK